jgi:penicillin-binding protein 1A
MARWQDGEIRAGVERARPQGGRVRPGRAVGLVALAAAVAGLTWAVSYAIVMQPHVDALPTLVRARLKTHGGGAYVPYGRLPPFLVDALVATEDRTFWTNAGLSFEGIARAAVVDIEHGAFVQGASTIQQQVVRDMFLSARKTLPRKLQGSVLAVLMTLDFPRREILSLYFNEVYLGQGAYGIARAARTYFGKSPSALTPAQCAVLAGLPQAPSYDDPLTNYAAAKARQAIVLESMVATGYITAARARALARAPLGLVRAPAHGVAAAS